MLDALEQFKGRRIVVAMSGGVDSALAAVVLKRAGAEVIGVHMRVWHYDGCEDLNSKIATCCSPADALDARRVAEQFDFPFYSIDFQADFRRSVIDPFISEYLLGRTPNPCVHCNTQLKLGTLLARARGYGAEAVATGHYARTRTGPTGRAELLRAVDLAKDQSYYLFELRQEQLARLVMPLGEITKAETRAAARELGLHLAEKAESQDICFVPEGDYRTFLRDEAELDEDALAGDIMDTSGRKLGRHTGVHNFTIGQRHGLGISAPTPLYVVDLRAETRTVVVGQDSETLSPGLIAGRINWVSTAPATGPRRVLAKIRYHHKPIGATLEVEASGGGEKGEGSDTDSTRVRITFDEPQRAVAPGQAVVLYDLEDEDVVVAGGWIEAALRPVTV